MAHIYPALHIRHLDLHMSIERRFYPSLTHIHWKMGHTMEFTSVISDCMERLFLQGT
jgi:hypothetical protein